MREALVVTKDIEAIIRRSAHEAATSEVSTRDFAADAIHSAEGRALFRRRIWSVLGTSFTVVHIIIGVSLWPQITQREKVQRFGTRVQPRLIAGAWKTGDTALLGEVRVRLYIDSKGCFEGVSVMLSSASPASASPAPDQTIAIVWPRGYTASRNQDGQAIIRDASNKIVAIENSLLGFGGGLGARIGDVCEEGTISTFYVQQDIPPIN